MRVTGHILCAQALGLCCLCSQYRLQTILQVCFILSQYYGPSMSHAQSSTGPSKIWGLSPVRVVMLRGLPPDFVQCSTKGTGRLMNCRGAVPCRLSASRGQGLSPRVDLRGLSNPGLQPPPASHLLNEASFATSCVSYSNTGISYRCCGLQKHQPRHALSTAGQCSLPSPADSSATIWNLKMIR